MADQDDTAKPTRRRRNQSKHTADARTAVAASDAASTPRDGSTEPLPLTPPQTLEEAIERVRTLLLEVRAMLHCLSEVLMYSDDDDGVLHAEVAQAAARWINDSAADLDLVKLRPLIESIKWRGTGTPSDGESGPGGTGLHQVREPTAVYYAA